MSRLLYIDGQWQAADSGAVLRPIAPATREALPEVACAGVSDVERAVAAAKRAFADWKLTSAAQRAGYLRAFAEQLEARRETLITLQMQASGKPRLEAEIDIGDAIATFAYYAELADQLDARQNAEVALPDAGYRSQTRFEPIGVVGLIVPWNFPLVTSAWKVAPALAAGCTVVIKPSEFTSCSTLALMALIEEAGFPPGVVNTVTGYGAEIGTALTEHPLVAKVAFTGGDATGAAVYGSAAKGLKHVTLELGGKSPNIIFDDARIEDAVKGAISGIFAASGQTCIAGSRLLVQRSVYEEVANRVAAFAGTARLGDPMEAETQVGPITTLPQREKVLSYIGIAQDEGARCLLGGGTPKAPGLAQGWFVEPTVFADVTNTMRIAREEVFGPVLSIIPFEDEAHAVEIANDTIYGLAAGVWTGSTRRAFLMADRLQAGTVWVNTYRAVSFMAPFGGYKRSGIGRESGQDAIYEYLQTKTVWMNLAEGVPNPFVLR